MTRASREQVEDVLQGLPWDVAVVEAICRDWLDMQAREQRLVAVVKACRKFLQVCSEDNETRIRLWTAIHLASLSGALDAYDAVDTDDN
jgi:hypothetical protein